MSGISAQTCETDSSLFSLTCTGVAFKIDVEESCLASGQSKYSLSADFDTSFYVSRNGAINYTYGIGERIIRTGCREFLLKRFILKFFSCITRQVTPPTLPILIMPILMLNAK